MAKNRRPRLCPRHSSLKKGRTGFALSASLAAALFGQHATKVNAQATTWNGATSTTWGTSTNWSNGTPTAASIATFNTAFTNQPTTLDATGDVAGAVFVGTGVGSDVIIGSATARPLTLTGNLTVTGSDGVTTFANTAILLDDAANHNLTFAAGDALTLSNSTSFLVNNAGTLTIGGSIALGANTLTLGGNNASGITTISGVIGFGGTAGSLIVNTAGTVNLSGANLFTGTTTLTAGTLRATNAGALGNGTATLSLGGGVLQLANASGTGLNFARNTTVTGNTQITTDVLAAGAGNTQTLGTLSIGAFTLNVAGGSNVTSGTAGITFGATTLTGASIFNITNPANGGATLLTLGTINGGNTLTLTGNGNFRDAGVFSGMGGLTLDTTYSGTATLAAASTYSGATAVNGGTLALGVASGFSSSSTYIVGANGTINAANFTSSLNGLSVQGGLVTGTSGVLSSLSNVDGQSGTISAILGGAFGLTKTTAGTLTLTGNNTFTGTTLLSAGVLRATTSVNALGAGVATLSLGGGELQLANVSGTNLNFARNTTVTANTQITSDLTAAGAGDTFTLGTLSIGAQTLTIAGGSNVTSGTAGVTIGATTLTGAATFTVTNPANGGGTTLTLGNTISGNFGLTKSGNGLLLMSGAIANTYTGITTVSGGELDLGKVSGNTVYTAIPGDLAVSNATVKLLATGQFATASNVSINQGGTLNLNSFGTSISTLTLTGASNNVATLNLGNAATGGILRIGTTTGGTDTLTFGPNTALIGGGTITNGGPTGTGATALSQIFNFNGGQVSGPQISIGSTLVTSNTFNITAGMGGGNFVVGQGVTSALPINLNATGDLNLGSTIAAYTNTSGGLQASLNVTVAATQTGFSGGVITPALDLVSFGLNDTANPAGTARFYSAAANVLTFATGSSTGFTLSGGILDVRSGTAASGVITTNGRALTISGGQLLGNSLASTSGAITLSSGILGLRASAAPNFTISTTTGTDGRTITMPSGGTGVFEAVGTVANSTIAIPTQASGGAWNLGTVNAGANYTITGGFSTTATTGFATYSVADNSALNGLALGTQPIPTLLTLGANSGFFVATSAAPARTYNVGVSGGTNDIVVPGSGSFSFGINNQTAANTQIINLNRDKGSDSITLLNNGASTTSAVNVAVSQTGSGNLYVNAKNIVLNAGTTFGGTGGIYSDVNPTNGFLDGVLGLPGIGPVTGSTGANSQLLINGTINGTNTIFLNGEQVTGNNTSGITIGATGVVGGTQTWTIRGTTGGALAFGNNSTTPANWTNNSVSLFNTGITGTYEASTNSSNPTTSSDYKFNTLSFVAGNSQNGQFRLVNNTINDGGATGAKEGLYAGSITLNVGDGSGGRATFNLNGQDLYIDRFNAFTGNFTGYLFQNDALGTVSDIRAVGTMGDNLVGGGFQVLNGATLEVVGGNYINTVSTRAGVSSVPADNAAAPNNGTQTTNNTTSVVNAFDGVANYISAGTTTSYRTVTGNTSFLGSGSLKTTANPAETANGTNGTLRILGGDYTTNDYVLNPVGTVGLIDTMSVTGSPVSDTTLNTVTIRGTNASDVNGAAIGTLFPALVVAGTTTINGNLAVTTTTGAINQSTLRVGGVTAGTGTLSNNIAVTALGAFTNTGGSVAANGTFAVTLAYTTDFANGTTVSAAGTVSATAVVTNGTLTSLTINPSTASGATLGTTSRFGALTPPTGLTIGTQPTFAGIFSGATTDGTAILNVTGDMTIGASNNLAVQSNATVNVGGNVSIAGVGSNQPNNITGVGVGFNAASNFTLNGNKGVSTPQTISITPTLGNFNVGVAAGTAAQAQLLSNLNVATATNINGATSSLNLNARTLTTPTLTVGGSLMGSGTVLGAVAVNSGGTLAPSSGNTTTVGMLTLSSLTVNNGAALVFGFTNTANDTIGVTGVLNLAGNINVTLVQEGTTNQLTTAGGYNLISYTTGGTIDTTGLTVANPVAGYSYSFVNDTGLGQIELNVTAVPEPSTWMAGGLCAGFVAFHFARRRKGKSVCA